MVYRVDSVLKVKVSPLYDTSVIFIGNAALSDFNSISLDFIILANTVSPTAVLTERHSSSNVEV